jgi:UPF0176 protein
MFRIAAFYKFADLPRYREVRDSVEQVCADNGILGTILLASEGINGTIAGPADGVEAVLSHLRRIQGLEDLTPKESTAQNPPFLRLKVRLKKEIVALGVGEVDTVANTGVQVPPTEWNDLISQSDVIVIDTRNDYEYTVGTFDGAINPGTRSFTDFPGWIETSQDLVDKPKIAMFCTGGIRCEKASAYLREQGFDEVYQLEGGILRYLETIPEDESTWDGECYVFDRRVTVRHGLEPGDKEVCVNCNRVLDRNDREADGYVEGVTCGACHTTITEDRRARFAERQHQIELSRERGSSHLGTTCQERLIEP